MDTCKGKNICRPKKRWIDNIRSDCCEIDMNLCDETSHARDTEGWRTSVEKLPLGAQASRRH
jgi:hypothetical protein